MRSGFVAVVALLLAQGCGHLDPTGSAKSPRAYHAAVHEASAASAGRISHDLVRIARDNPQLQWHPHSNRVLVTTWKSRDAYNRFIKARDHSPPNEDHLLWVTAANQVRGFCSRYLLDRPGRSGRALDSRLKQYLGLHPSWQYEIFIELWVNPDDLFRPCVDPEVTDASCKLDFGDSLPVVHGIRDYAGFYRNLYFKSFHSEPGVPWTGLGYTYDWGNPENPQGASEFILRPGAPYAIHAIHSTLEYCQPEFPVEDEPLDLI